MAPCFIFHYSVPSTWTGSMELNQFQLSQMHRTIPKCAGRFTNAQGQDSQMRRTRFTKAHDDLQMHRTRFTNAQDKIHKRTWHTYTLITKHGYHVCPVPWVLHVHAHTHTHAFISPVACSLSSCCVILWFQVAGRDSQMRRTRFTNAQDKIHKCAGRDSQMRRTRFTKAQDDLQMRRTIYKKSDL